MNVVITGSIAYDYLMRFPGHFKEHFLPEALEHISLSFLVDDMTKHWGGVAANIAFTMAKLGISPKLLGTVGRDFGDYRRWLESNGVDCSTVVQIDEVFTASFFCNTDEDNNQLAFFYGGAMNLARNYSLGGRLERCARFSSRFAQQSGRHGQLNGRMPPARNPFYLRSQPTSASPEWRRAQTGHARRSSDGCQYL